MAMDKQTMADRIKANIQALSNCPVNGQTPAFVDERVIVAICQGIIDEMVANAEILPNTFVSPAGQPVTLTPTPMTSAPNPIQGEGKII